MTKKYRIRFEGPSVLAVQVATELADADGIDLTSSKPPLALDAHTFALEMTVEATPAAVDAAVESISRDLPEGASIHVVDR